MKKFQNQTAKAINDDLTLESVEVLSPGQVAQLKFYEAMEAISCTVRKVHNDGKNYSYDLELWLQNPEGEEHTRIYNIDSRFVAPI